MSGVLLAESVAVAVAIAVGPRSVARLCHDALMLVDCDDGFSESAG